MTIPAPRAVRVLHVSDLHFGPPYNPPVIAALEARIAREGYDAVVVAGDLTQRSLSGEFQRAEKFLRDCQRVSKTMVIPGNHDVAWWDSPMHLLGADRIYRRYRKYIAEDLEPTLELPGATFVGLNTSHGIAPYTLTTRPRDLSIIGAVTSQQLQRTQDRLRSVAPSFARVVVMHHNPVRGQLSNRYGVPRAESLLDQLASAGADMVLCGHDHQEAVHQRTHAGRNVVICTSGTVSDRSRGGRPCAVHEIRIGLEEILVDTLAFDQAVGHFQAAASYQFARSRA